MKIAIVDDELAYRCKITELINERYPSFKVDTFDDAKGFISTNVLDYDIAFLDIEIGDTNGIDIALQMRQKGAKTLICFVTNYTKYISESFKTIPFQYIVKPIDEKIFDRELNRAVDFIEHSNKELEIKTSNGNEYIKIKDIIYIEYASRKVLVHTKEKIYATYNTMKNILSYVIDYNFARCHSGYIVNIVNIKSIKGNEILMNNEDIVPISRKYIVDVRNQFLRYKAVVKL